MAENQSFDTEMKWYLANLRDLLAKYDGKVLVIKGEKLLGAYSSEIEAYYEAEKKEPKGTFLVKRCSSEPKPPTLWMDIKKKD